MFGSGRSQRACELAIGFRFSNLPSPGRWGTFKSNVFFSVSSNLWIFIPGTTLLNLFLHWTCWTFSWHHVVACTWYATRKVFGKSHWHPKPSLSLTLTFFSGSLQWKQLLQPIRTTQKRLSTIINHSIIRRKKVFPFRVLYASWPSAADRISSRNKL